MARPIVVVADTSPLNYLVLLGCPDVLSRLYGRVLIPQGVLDELRHANTPTEVRIWIEKHPDWLEVTAVASLDPSLPSKLGRGEREAISLAIERRADAILMDDAPGRFAAKARRLTVNGTLFVVLEAAIEGHLDFERALTQLRQIGFRFSGAVEDDMRARYERGKAQ